MRVYCRAGLRVFAAMIALLFTAGCAGVAVHPAESEPATKATIPVSMAETGRARSEFWKKKVEEFVHDNWTREPGGVVLLGDSITQGFPVEKLFPDLKVTNRGIGGDIIAGVRGRLGVSVYDLQPKKLFLLIGVNDINLAKETIPQLAARYDDLIGEIRKNAPETELAVQSVLPLRDKFAPNNGKVLELNEEIKKVAAKHRIEYLDVHPLLADDKGELKAEFTGDGIHLTPAGYEVWANFLRPKLSAN